MPPGTTDTIAIWWRVVNSKSSHAGPINVLLIQALRKTQGNGSTFYLY